MNVQLKVRNYDQFLFSKLEKNNYTYKEIKDAILIELKEFEIIENNLIYKIPKFLLGYDCEFEICEYESGGRNGECGEATVICSESGKRIKPLFVFKELRPNDKHAYFVLNDNFIKIKTYCPGAKIIIQRYSWNFDVDRFVIDIKEYFNGDIDNLSGVLKEAANQAYLKACTTDCKETFFIKED